MSVEDEARGPGAGEDSALLAALRRMWERQDPVPGDLADRVLFALSLENLEVEVMQLREELMAGARGEERARTVTFTSASLSVMITISAAADVRLDGWITSGGGLRVDLLAEGQDRSTTADDDGRFVFDGIASGLAQLVFQPTAGAQTKLARPVVTPAIQV
jgi:hypothetical protein